MSRHGTPTPTALWTPEIDHAAADFAVGSTLTAVAPGRLRRRRTPAIDGPRACEHCGGRLSRYNPNMTCYHHTEPRRFRNRGEKAAT